MFASPMIVPEQRRRFQWAPKCLDKSSPNLPETREHTESGVIGKLLFGWITGQNFISGFSGVASGQKEGFCPDSRPSIRDVHFGS
jgi:hypothetical protein